MLSDLTYSTCIGLILKGYDDFEHNRKQFDKDYKKVPVPDTLKQEANGIPETQEIDEVSEGKMKNRRNLTGFWGKFKDGIIELFKEEEDKHL